MDEEARRTKLAQNEYLLKQLNRRIDTLTAEFADDGLAAGDRSADFICACGSADCTERIRLQPEEYEHVRGQPHRFIVAPGHEHPKIERVVERHERYVVVEKLPAYREGRSPEV
jgi:hypothetical protein